MKDILTAPWMVEMIRTAENMYRQGWDERNGGNISLRLNEDEVAEYLDTTKVIREIPTGFSQPELVEKFLKEFTTQRTTVIVDPVMGDYGKLYATYTQELCQGIGRLVQYADILTPNVTEACILTGTPYQEHFTEAELLVLAQKLCDQGPEKVVITGVSRGSFLENYCYERDNGPSVQRTLRIAPQRSGTGDVFSSIVAAGAVHGVPFAKSVRTAAGFIRACLNRSAELDIPPTDGVCFEEVMDKLHF